MIVEANKLDDYRIQLKFIEATAVQLQKDFQLYDEKINFSGNAENAYDELYQQILPIISRMLNLDSARFFGLLHSIDISEARVRELLFGKKQYAVAEELAHMIIERELLKVVSRHIYSSTKE